MKIRSATIAVAASMLVLGPFVSTGHATTLSGVTSFGPSTSSLGGSSGVFPIHGNFDLVINFQGSGFTQEIKDAFTSAENFWESRILGYRDPELAQITSLTIDASVPVIDGLGGVLGQAGATHALFWTNFVTPTAGLMKFDNADANNLLGQSVFDDVVLHEMAHVMGFSNSLWRLNSEHTGITSTTDTTYTGDRGLSTYRDEFDMTAKHVPVEDSHGSGTAYSHWDEELFANHRANTGNSRNPELMTGFLDVLPPQISDTTVASFGDIGYATDVVPLQGITHADFGDPSPSSDVEIRPVSAVPIPASAPLLLAGLAAFGILRRRARTRALWETN